MHRGRSFSWRAALAGGPENNPILFINTFLKLLLPILENEKSVGLFSTSVMFVSKPDGSLPLMVTLFKLLCALLGMCPTMEYQQTSSTLWTKPNMSLFRSLVHVLVAWKSCLRNGSLCQAKHHTMVKSPPRNRRRQSLSQ